MNEHQFDIIIVNYNSTSFLKTCIESIHEYRGDIQTNIIVIDNNSCDGITALCSIFPTVFFQYNTKNIGFARAVNQGLKKGRAPYAMLLNPDTQINENFFKHIIRYLDHNPKVGVLGPKILDMDGTTQGSARKFPNALTALYGRTSPLTRFFPNNRISRANIMTIMSDGISPMKVDWVSGACMVVRRKAINQVGLMDERFFMYWEDADWCRRMRENGWKVVYFPQSSVKHHVGASSDRLLIRSTFEFHKSVFKLFDKYNRPGSLFFRPMVFTLLYFRFLILIIYQTQRKISGTIKRVSFPTKKSAGKLVPPDKIKVFRIISRMNIGGPAIHVKLLHEGLNRNRFDTKLVNGKISQHEGDMSYILAGDKSDIVSIPDLQREPSVFKDLKALVALLSLINREKPQIVHSHTAKAGSIARSAALIYNLYHKEQIKTVHTFHGHVFEGYFDKTESRLYIFAEQVLAKFTDAIIAISQTQKDELIHKYRIAGNQKFILIELGFNLELFLQSSQLKGQFRNQLKLDEDCILIGIIGRLVPIKNHIMFFKAASLLMSQNPGLKVKFVVVGDGELKQELESFCLENQLSKHVIFCGWIKSIPTVYADLDIVALTSINEGTPVSIIEAMASSVPIISTDAGGIKDLLGKIDTIPSADGFKICERGILLPQNNAQSLANGIKYLLDNKDFVNGSIAFSAKAFVLEKYHKERLIGDIESLYYRLMK